MYKIFLGIILWIIIIKCILSFRNNLYRPRKPFLITSYLLSIAAPKILTYHKSRLFYGSRNILTENIRPPFSLASPMNRQQREKRHKTYLHWLLRKYQRQFEKKIIIKAKDLEISLIPDELRSRLSQEELEFYVATY